MASFNSAFASARKSGKSEFTWNGKKYNTKLADAKPAKKFAATPKNAPVPTAKPKASKSAFSGVSSDDLGKAPVAKTGRDRFGPKAAPAKSGATQGFGVGEAKNSAAFKKANESARKFQKGALLTGKGEGTFMEKFKKGLK